MPTEMSVRPLVWVSDPLDDFRDSFEPGTVWALGVGGYYEAAPSGILWGVKDPFAFTEHQDQEAAKAAAQKDHEPRVLALLGPAPADPLSAQRER